VLVISLVQGLMSTEG